MLQIRLSKGALGSEGGTGTPKISGSDNVTVSCPDHLVLADLPVAKGLASPSNINLNVKAVKTVGRKRRRRQGDKVHICVICDFPIAIYGRLSPCEHAFCLMCARSEPSCYLCDERIQKIQTIKMLDGIFICGAPHCLRSFLKKYDFEQHLKDVHLDLLLPESEKEVQQKDVSTAKASVSDTQYKQQPLHVESQVLSHSVSAPSLHPSQQVPHAAESSSFRAQPHSVSMSPVTSPPEKQPQLNQSTGFIGTPVTSPPEKQFQFNQSIGSSSGANFQEQQKSEQKQTGYQQQFDNQGNTSVSPQQQNQVMPQVSEKQPNQSPQDYYQRHLRGERHHTNSELYQSPHSGQQYIQKQEKQQMDGLYQHNPAYPVLPQRPPMLVSANQPGIPPFPNYPYHLSYPMPPEVQPQQSAPQFDSTRSGPPVDEVAVQASMQNVQENNQRMPMQSPFIPQMQDGCQMTQHAGNAVVSNEGTSVIAGPQEVYMHPNRPGPFSHFQGDLGQVPAGMPMQLVPQGMGIGFDQSSHFQDPAHGPEMPSPLPNHRTYQNMPAHMDAGASYGWGGGRPNFGGHGYGSWSGPS